MGTTLPVNTLTETSNAEEAFVFSSSEVVNGVTRGGIFLRHKSTMDSCCRFFSVRRRKFRISTYSYKKKFIK